MSTFSFSLAGPDSRDIAELVDRAFDTGETRPPPPTSSSATAVVDPIRRPFVSDPVSAVIDAIPPNEDPDDIRRWNIGGRIDRFVDHEEAARKRQTTLSSEPLYKFAKLVDSFLNTGQKKKLEGINVFFEPPKPAYEPPVAQREGEPARPAFRYDERAAEADYQYGESVNAVLKQPETTGVVQLSDDTMGGVESGLSNLFAYDPVKFEECKLEMFLANDHALRLMAQLAAECITNKRVQNPSDYRKDLDWARSVETINSTVKRMSAELKRVEGKFVCETPKQVIINRRKQVSHGPSSDETPEVVAVLPRSSKRYFSGSSSVARRKY
jgi:hypothetical protein